MGAMTRKEIKRHAVALAKMRGWNGYEDESEHRDTTMSHCIPVDIKFESNRSGKARFNFQAEASRRMAFTRKVTKI